MRNRVRLNMFALQQVLRPVYTPNPVLGVAPFENLQNIPQPVDLITPPPIGVVKEEVKKDVSILHKQNIDAPIELPPKTYWMGDPV